MKAIRHYLIKKLGGFVDQTEERDYFWKTVRKEVISNIYYEMVSSIDIGNLKNIVDKAYKDRENGLGAKYSLIAELIKRKSSIMNKE